MIVSAKSTVKLTFFRLSSFQCVRVSYAPIYKASTSSKFLRHHPPAQSWFCKRRWTELTNLVVSCPWSFGALLHPGSSHTFVSLRSASFRHLPPLLLHLSIVFPLSSSSPLLPPPSVPPPPPSLSLAFRSSHSLLPPFFFIIQPKLFLLQPRRPVLG